MNGAEEWRRIQSCPRYEASTLGRIRHVVSLRIRKPYWNNRWSSFQLTMGCARDGNARSFLVHRLVAEAFLGSCPTGREVNHIDGDRHHNWPAKLEYVTHKQNMEHASRTFLQHPGERTATAKLREPQIREIRQLYGAARGHSSVVLGKRFGVAPFTIMKIVHRQAWKHVV